MKKRTIQAILLVVLIVTLLQVQVVAYEGTWTQMSPTLSPPLRGDACFVYDSESDVSILCFGSTGEGGIRYNDTWAYDVDSDSWSNMSPAVAPPVRLACQYAYDSGSDKIILFSGFYGSGNHHNDTWSYDYNTNIWANLSPAVMPIPRRYGGMAYDAESDRTILFGGIQYGGGPIGDTWAYDYNTNSWENMNPSWSPSSRFGPAMTYDSESDRIIMFGGNYPDIFTDTWAYNYNNNTWENMNPSTHPDAVPGAIVYNAEEDLCMTFGGAVNFAETQFSNETWAYDYDGNEWNEVTVDLAPEPRSRALLVHDSDSNVTLLHGGMGPGRWDNLLNDTWSFEFKEENGNGGWDWWPFALLAVGAGVVILVLVVFVRRR